MTQLPKEPSHSRNRSWKHCIGIALDEGLLALQESFHDLSDEQVWSRPIRERHSIGTMVMHALQNLDQHACRFQTAGGVTMADASLFDVWRASGPEELDRRQKGRELPSVAQMLAWLGEIRELAVAGLEQATDEDLLGPRAAAEWCRQHDRTAGDAYTRTIFHTAAHVRQIWCLRGVIGAYGKNTWPRQFYA